jgi:hypothetical protein
MREAVRDVARYFPTAIVTGRCRNKVSLAAAAVVILKVIKFVVGVHGVFLAVLK